MIKTALVRDIVALRRVMIAERARDPEAVQGSATAWMQVAAIGWMLGLL
jgi:hypothetical protein